MIIRSFLRSPSGVVVAETVLLAVLQFGTFSVLVRVTSMETVGLWVLVNAILGFSRAADFWSRGLSSFIGDARGRGKMESAADFVSTAVLTGVVGYGVLAALGGALVYILAQPLAGPPHVELVQEISPLMALTFWILSVAGIYQAGFLAFGRPALKATQTIGGACLFLALALGLAPSHGLWGILVAQAIQATAMLLYAIFTFHGRLARGRGSPWRRDQFTQLVGFGSKALAVGALQLAIEPVIRLLASQFGGLGAVAAVELASRLITVARSVITALGQILVPEFARLTALADTALSALYSDVGRLFLLASLSAFSLLASAAPAVEDIILGRTDTGFVLFLCTLSVGWFANTVTAPAYFLLLGRRSLRPLFWANMIMSGGAIALGVTGGWLFGVNGAMAGAAVALVAASLFLLHAAETLGTPRIDVLTLLRREPERLLPITCAGSAVALIEISGVVNDDIVARGAAYSAAILATLTAALMFGDIRGLIRSAAKIR